MRAEALVPIYAGAPQHYRPEIDGLRAVAVSAVIIYHLCEWILPGGFLGVDMFFVISGYVITTSLATHSAEDLWSFITGFYSRRFKRLAPALLVCVLITGFLGSLFIDPKFPDYSASMRAGVSALFGVSNLFFSRQAISYIGTEANLNLFTQTWSLGVEEQFYLCFPFVLWLSAQSKRRGRAIFMILLVLLAAGSFGYLLKLGEGRAVSAFYLMPPRFWELAVGCLIVAGGLRLPSRVLSGTCWIGSSLVVVSLFIPIAWQLYSTPLMVLGTALLIMSLRKDQFVFRVLTLDMVVGLGLISYSAYLWHWSIFTLARWTTGLDDWITLLYLVVILAVSTLSYFCIERPLRRAIWSISTAYTVAIGIGATACVAGLMLGIKAISPNLYTGNPTQLTAVGPSSLTNEKWHDGRRIWRALECIVSADDLKTIEFDNCTLGGLNASKPRVLVIGNSFSAAEFEMYSALAESNVAVISATSAWGVSPVPRMTGWTREPTPHYWQNVVPPLLSHLRSGDVVVMLSDLSQLTLPEHNDLGRSEVARFESSLKEFVATLGARGIKVIFQAPTPLMREANCTLQTAQPNWFRFGRETRCVYYTKAQTLARRRLVDEALEAVRVETGNLYILDLLPVLCADDMCRLYDRDGVLLYRDLAHLSIEANLRARPAFLEVANRALHTPVVRAGD